MGDTGTLIVTGGTGGIGKAIVRDAIARGYSICFSFALNGEAASQLIDEMKREGGHVIGVRCDVTNETDIANLFHRAGAELGPVNGLVNNAGITGPIGPFATASMTTIRNVVDVNLMGTMLCTQHAVKTWQASGMAGTVVNISSIAATLGAPGEYVHYAASKAAVEAFTIGLGKELGPSGIRVNAVSPGTILTDIHAKAGEPGRTDRIAPNVPLRRVGQPEEIAHAVLWLLSPAASYVTGSVLRVTGGL